MKIFIEPNFYLNKTTSWWRDYRKYLNNHNGRKKDGIHYTKYNLIYDRIYRNKFKTHVSKWYKIIEF